MTVTGRKSILEAMGFSWENLASEGEGFYQKLKKHLLGSGRGKFAAIDVKAEEFFVGTTLTEAYQKAKKKYPKHKFHFVRIGFPTAVSYKHRTRP